MINHSTGSFVILILQTRPPPSWIKVYSFAPCHSWQTTCLNSVPVLSNSEQAISIRFCQFPPLWLKSFKATPPQQRGHRDTQVPRGPRWSSTPPAFPSCYLHCLGSWNSREVKTFLPRSTGKLGIHQSSSEAISQGKYSGPAPSRYFSRRSSILHRSTSRIPIQSALRGSGKDGPSTWWWGPGASFSQAFEIVQTCRTDRVELCFILRPHLLPGTRVSKPLREPPSNPAPLPATPTLISL